MIKFRHHCLTSSFYRNLDYGTFRSWLTFSLLPFVSWPAYFQTLIYNSQPELFPGPFFRTRPDPPGSGPDRLQEPIIWPDPTHAVPDPTRPDLWPDLPPLPVGCWHNSHEFKSPTHIVAWHSVRIHYREFRVREFVPTPTRCYACQAYGHTAKGCSRATTLRCPRCAGNHAGKDCTREGTP